MKRVQRNVGGIYYEQSYGVRNPQYRHDWVANQLGAIASTGSLLDVGAGTGRYRSLIQQLGFKYFAHDFAGYAPDKSAEGLQNETWEYTDLQYRCDILDIPENVRHSVVLCTEVLEHVPDPVRSFYKLGRLVEEGGYLLISVPFLSLMHQAPHWHSSGLSPFFFDYWAPFAGLEVEEIVVHGDFVDLLLLETHRAIWAARMPFRAAWAWGTERLISRLRSRVRDDVLSSGAFGVTVRARRRAEVAVASSHWRGREILQ